jgi:hypothetical protein
VTAKLDNAINTLFNTSTVGMDTKKIGRTVLNLVDASHEKMVSKSYIQELGSKNVKEREINGG